MSAIEDHWYEVGYKEGMSDAGAEITRLRAEVERLTRERDYWERARNEWEKSAHILQEENKRLTRERDEARSQMGATVNMLKASAEVWQRERAAAERKLAVVVEALHWIDEQARDLVSARLHARSAAAELEKADD